MAEILLLCVSFVLAPNSLLLHGICPKHDAMRMTNNPAKKSRRRIQL